MISRDVAKAFDESQYMAWIKKKPSKMEIDHLREIYIGFHYA